MPEQAVYALFIAWIGVGVIAMGIALIVLAWQIGTA